jgi:NAD(P)-dependent dehydrogenase (short-subunit alcohol dehydrogenase family)
MDDLFATNFTKTTHKESYPAISPSRPELSQAGRSVLITGGGTSIGKSIAEHYVLASAANVIVVGRRLEVLQAAAAELSQKGQANKSPAKVIPIKADVSEKTAIIDLFREIAQQGIELDVLVLNAAKFTADKSIMETGADDIWSQVETNLRGPLYLAELFLQQNLEKQKVGPSAHHFEKPETLTACGS